MAATEPEIALKALHEGDAVTAFAFADRWRRISGATSENLLARFEASRLMGMENYAHEDLVFATERDPFHLICNLKLIEFGPAELADSAARRLLEHGQIQIAIALEHLSRLDDVSGVAVLHFQAPGRIEGWVAWRAGKKAKLIVHGANAEEFSIVLDSTDPRAQFFGCASALAVDIFDPASELATVQVDGETIARIRLPGRGAESEKPLHCSPGSTTVIVPVYDDFDATRACLETATAASKFTPNAQLLIVDDASRDPKLPAFLRKFAELTDARLIVNSRNRGYVATVNRALSLVPDGDVLLLNADTLVAPDILHRFREIARLDPLIGSINPLSNHGEFVSFPKPFVENAFEACDWRRVHKIAGKVNKGVAIDTPASIGFCQFITRACLQATGALNDEYENGYLEDADFALRIREAGFRNVCAPSIFVPHMGSRSFRGEKRDLVARNLKVLNRCFPDHESECEAYLLLDPLAPARARIETALISDRPSSRLLIGPKRAARAMEARTEFLGEEGVHTLVGAYEHDGAGWRLKLRGACDGAPQSVEIDLDDQTAIAETLTHIPVDRIELVTEHDLPRHLAAALAASGARLWRLAIEAQRAEPTPTIVVEAEIGLCAMSRAACARESVSSPAKISLPTMRDAPAVGVILPMETPQTLGFLLGLETLARDLGRDFIVLGETSIDHRLMGRGLFVTGPVGDRDKARVVDQYRIGRYLLPYRVSHYWALESYRRQRLLPAAYFNWSGADFHEYCEDLSLDGALEDASAIAMLATWLQNAEVNRVEKS